MSFIDLMSHTIFTESDILKRTESMIRTYYSREQENILNRKMTGVMTGTYTLSESESMEIQDFSIKIMQARQVNIKATADNELLKKIIEVEKSYLRSISPVIEEILEEDVVTNSVEIAIDLEERSLAQSVVDNASGDVMDWVHLRNPVVEVEVEIDPEVVL